MKFEGLPMWALDEVFCRAYLEFIGMNKRQVNKMMKLREQALNELKVKLQVLIPDIK